MTWIDKLMLGVYLGLMCFTLTIISLHLRNIVKLLTEIKKTQEEGGDE